MPIYVDLWSTYVDLWSTYVDLWSTFFGNSRFCSNKCLRQIKGQHIPKACWHLIYIVVSKKSFDLPMLTCDDLPSHSSCGTIRYWGRSKVNIIFAEKGYHVDLRATMLSFDFLFFCLPFLVYYCRVLLWQLFCLVVFVVVVVMFPFCLLVCCLVCYCLLFLFCGCCFVGVGYFGWVFVLLFCCCYVVWLFWLFWLLQWGEYLVMMTTTSQPQKQWIILAYNWRKNPEGAVLQEETGCTKGLDTFFGTASLHAQQKTCQQKHATRKMTRGKTLQKQGFQKTIGYNFILRHRFLRKRFFNHLDFAVKDPWAFFEATTTKPL